MDDKSAIETVVKNSGCTPDGLCQPPGYDVADHASRDAGRADVKGLAPRDEFEPPAKR